MNDESRKPYRKPWVAPRRGGYAPDAVDIENPEPPKGAASVALRNYELWNAVEIEANAKSTANRLCARWEFKNWIRVDRTPTRRQDFLDGAIAGYLAAKGIEE